MAEWFYALDDQQKGPVTWEILQQLAASGKLQRNDMVWREGMAEWRKASQIDGLFPRADVDIARRRGPRDDGDDAEERRPRRMKKRKKEYSPGAIAAIIGGSVAGGILILVV